MRQLNRDRPARQVDKKNSFQAIPWEARCGFLWGLPATIWFFVRHPMRAFDSMTSLSLWKLHLFVVLALLFIDIIGYVLLTVLDILIKYTTSDMLFWLIVDNFKHLFKSFGDLMKEAWPTAIISLFLVSYIRAYVQNKIFNNIFYINTTFSGFLRIWLYSYVGEVWMWSLVLLSFPGMIWAYIILPIIGTKVVYGGGWGKACLSVIAALVVSFIPVTLLYLYKDPSLLLIPAWSYDKWDPSIFIPRIDFFMNEIINWSPHTGPDSFL